MVDKGEKKDNKKKDEDILTQLINDYVPKSERLNLIIHTIAGIFIPIFYLLIYSEKLHVVYKVSLILMALTSFVFLLNRRYIALIISYIKNNGMFTFSWSFHTNVYGSNLTINYFDPEVIKILIKALYIICDLLLINMIVFAGSAFIYTLIYGKPEELLITSSYVKIHGFLSFLFHLVYLCLARRMYELSKNVIYVIFFAVYVFSVLFTYFPEYIQQVILHVAYYDVEYVKDVHLIVNYHFPPIREAILAFIIFDTTRFLEKKQNKEKN